MAISPVRIAILSVAVAFAALARDFRVPAGCVGEEIQRAIDDAFSAGGGRVVVTPGVHHTGTLRLKSRVELHLQEGAVLVGSVKKEDYSDFPNDVCGVAPEYSRKVLLQAWDAEDIAVTGKGMIDGQGPAFYDDKPADTRHWPKPAFRPLMVEFVRCRGVRLEGVTFKDSPMWTMFIRLCEDVSVDGITVVGDQRMINNDGIDFDGCRRVRVGNSTFKTGDDCLILRAMRERPGDHVVCEDVVVSNCVLDSTCQAIRMGCPSDDTVRNAVFRNIKASGMNGIFFDYPVRYVRPYDEGYMDISNIVFDGFEGAFAGSAVQIVAEPGVKIRGVRDVVFRNFKVESAQPLRFTGNADSVLTRILLEGVEANVSGDRPLETAATEPLTLRTCRFNGQAMPDGDHFSPRGERKPFIRASGISWETAACGTVRTSQHEGDVSAVTCANCATVGSPASSAKVDYDQVNEAAAVFEGKIPAKMRGGTWKVVYSSAEGPEGRALEVLTERMGTHLLREGHLATPMVLPLEKDGGEEVDTKRDVVVIGRLSQNATLRKCLKDEDVPKGGYLVKTMRENGRNVVLLAGDTPEAVLWAAFDFLDVVAPTLEAKMSGMHGRYVGTFFRGGKIPAFECRRVPQTPVRSVFSWGHVVDDYRASFREMARARFNRAILWNDQLVVNAREVVECARSWGVRVYWGFSWGWTLSGNDGKDLDFGKLADDIVAEWRCKWKPMGGDGIYFQSFTETDKREIGGRSIPEAVTELVNAVAARIHAEAPDVDIVFGLHANSMKREGAEEAIAKVDPSLEILWENCGGFPFWEAEGKESSPDVAFCDRILALNPSVGLAWKAQLRIDWGNYVPPAGPFVLGCAGERLRDRDRTVTAPRQWSFDEDWILNGANAHEFVRHVRAGKRPPKEFNAVAEYNPPYSFATHCQAELFWNSDDDWEEIAKRARLRARPER